MKHGWFLTELIYRIHDQNCPSVYQFDKQMRLIKGRLGQRSLSGRIGYGFTRTG